MKKFRVTSVQSVPHRVGVKLKEFDQDKETESWPFRELVGGFIWLAISTRPDISNSVRSVARYCTTPKAIHWKAALDILAYIKDTYGFSTTYQRGSSVGISLEVFADADYASKATDRRSVSGGASMCGGACVCWFSMTQKCVTLSTSGAEYVTLVDTVKELALLDRSGVSCYPVRECHQFQSLKIIIGAQCNSRKTRYRTQTQGTLTFAIIF